MIEALPLFDYPVATTKPRVPPRSYRVGSRTVRPTELFSRLWWFAAERQQVLFARLEGRPGPWTQDPILQRYRFTNAYRVADRVSQFLIANVIYDDKRSAEETTFRILLFKLFNKIETWKLFEDKFGEVSLNEYSFPQYNGLLSEALNRGRRIYSAAYIVPNPPFAEARKHGNHLRLIERMFEDGLVAKLVESSSLRDVYTILRSYPSLGPFLAFQLAVDLAYSNVLRCSESDFVVPGPGAMDGLSKCFVDLGGLSATDAIMWMTESAEDHFRQFDIDFTDLYGRCLQPIDVQNLLCEISKYSRVSHPHLPGVSGRTRIKQEFRSRPEPVELRLPAKWGSPTRVSAHFKPARV